MKKLLIWDGDETLWNGTILDGDKPVFPTGRLALLEELHDRGVLQALATFNHSEDIAAVIHQHGLHRWFLHDRAGFGETKSQMVKGIISAYDLSRGTDVVFLDDQEFNRADVAANVPGVLCFSADYLEHVVKDLFTKEHYTDEDRLRVRRYQSDEKRQAAAVAYPGGHQEFLRSCGILMELRYMTDADIPRVLDLYNRANRMAAVDPGLNISELKYRTVFVANISDLYGNYGLSAFIVLKDAKIQALVVSCRLQGRGIGSALLGHIINRHVGYTVRAEWEENKYNLGMRDLFKWYHFKFEEDEEVYTTETRISARLRVHVPVELPDWVEVKE